ncbi:MAG: hypothetical protein FWF97_02455 [Alphaproteobacteria bacterium]|nr:hypothetical protein [Alphaproteobacteria bacterium]
MKFTKSVICALCSMLWLAPAQANWEYYAPGGYLGDDGSRITITARGGMAFGTGRVENDLGSLIPEPYWYDPDIGVFTESWCGGYLPCLEAGFIPIGQINIGDLPAAKKFQPFSFAGGVAVGLTLPYSPQWRLEASWDRITRSDYNALPMFRGDVVSTEGYVLEVESTGVQSNVTTDVYSAMVYYDFFDGLYKPLKAFIPYLGFGLGYADSTTVLNLIDLYGDLSDQASMQDFGEDLGTGVLTFYTSKTSTNNVALSGAVGFSYGLAESIFLDLSFRLMWIPQIKWALNNEPVESVTGYKTKDIFSAHNVFYGTAMVGVRFEF